MSHNQNNDIMKPTDYIEWDNLKNIPFFLCQVVEDKENKDIDIYYLGKRVFHDYDHDLFTSWKKNKLRISALGIIFFLIIFIIHLIVIPIFCCIHP